MTELTSLFGSGDTTTLILMIVGIGAVFYFGSIRPQQKQEKKMKEMLNRMEVGDEVVTIGGIVGRIISVSATDETILIESGSDRSRIRVIKSAIQSNNTKRAEMAEADKAAKEAKKEKKEKK